MTPLTTAESFGRPQMQPAKSDAHIAVRVLRQDRPDSTGYWQTFCVEHESGMNVISVLQRIAAHPQTDLNQEVAPVAYEANCLEEVCGSCTMLINGRVRQACSALVDRLIADDAKQIELRPLGKYPVIRDLIVDRNRLFRALEKLHCWLPVDGYYDAGPGPRQSQEQQQLAYPLSQCMSCGCCLEACPQYKKIESQRRNGETVEQFTSRRNAEFDDAFIGAHAMNQVVFTNSHPTGRMTEDGRIAALIGPGGIQNCGKAGNCQSVCPKQIPLMTSWARAGRAATVYALKRFFGES
jgi:succinate dehydrogenase / fumarate reductase iron-sulfur subunit